MRRYFVPSTLVFRRAAACAAALMMTSVLAAPPAEAHHAGPQPGPVNAANTYGWRPVKWHYNWFDPCEATTDPCEPPHYRFYPWKRFASGSGTAYIRWGMMVLDSSVEQFYFPSHGSVTAILDRRGARYGRWEMRLRAPVWYDEGRDYRVLAELVPADPAKRRCGARNIALASFVAGGSRVNVFARNAGQQWTYTKRPMTLGRWNWHTYAVEVTRRRISWFIDAHVVATVRNSRASSDVRLTPRLRLRGVPGAAMDRARIGLDWVRHWTLERPNEKSVRAPAPTVKTYRGC
jgi:Glycosyl hydrolases family 16